MFIVNIHCLVTLYYYIIIFTLSFTFFCYGVRSDVLQINEYDDDDDPIFASGC